MMQFVVGRRGLLFGAVAVMVAASVTPAAAQQDRGTIVVGGAIGAAATGDTWEVETGGGSGPLGSVYVDIPVYRARRVRFDTGLASWSPSNDVRQGTQVGRLFVSHAGVTLLEHGDAASSGFPPGLYGGIGVAIYRYGVGHDRHRSGPGLNLLAGFQHVPRGRVWGIQVEAGLAFIGTPGFMWFAPDLLQPSLTMGVSRRF